MALSTTRLCLFSRKLSSLLSLMGFVFYSVHAKSFENSMALPAVGKTELHILSPTILELSLVSTKAPDPATVTNWNFIGENFTASLPSPNQFVVQANGATIAVTEVGFKRRPVYAPLKTRDLRIGNYLYLRLASPLSEGQSVSVQNPDGTLWSDTGSFTSIAEPLRYNPALHVNQQGYLSRYTKQSMVGFYLGSLGELEVPSATFNIVDAETGSVRFTGTLTARKDSGFTYTPTPYQRVFEADFTAFTAPGEYRLQVPGMGASYPFLIDDGTAAAFARTLALGLYHQRCGGANQLPFTRHEHGVCHTAPAAVPDMSYTAVNSVLANVSSDYASNPLHTAPQLKDVNSSLYPFINKGPIDVSGGHHDAGDYSKYTINSAGLIHHLIFAVDNFPGVAALDNLGIPESGDGRSDLLQEAKWESDFLCKMQDADGGFYFLVYPRDREYEDNVLPDHGDPQVVFPKTTAVTAAAVGALAEISSSPAFRAQFPNEAALCLDKARRGWTFLTNAIGRFGKNGSYQKITHYGNEFMHDDELAWAAAALFVATGEQSFETQLKSWYDPSDPNTRRWSWWRLFEGYGCAARAYAFAARSGRLPAAALDANYLAKCEAEIVAAGDDIARFAQESAYGTSFPDPNKSFRTAGWYFSSERSFELATAKQIRNTPSYLEALLSNMNYEGGCNPVNVPYITGLGWQRWRDIVHQYAQNDYQVLPPTGLPLGNIQGGFAWLENYKRELGQLCFPPDGASSAPYPFYDRWGDSFNTTTEFVVVDQARALASLALLMADSQFTAPYTRAAASISGIPASVAADQSVTVMFNAPGVNLTGARIVWEGRDQQPFIGNPFTFAPKNPGEQWLEAEALLPDGTRLICKTNFVASYSESGGGNTDQSTPVTPTADVMALYHLDESLADATGKNPALVLSGQAAVDSNNLGWMSTRSGKALRVYDLGDKATVTLPAVLPAPGASEITLEAMVYVNAYKAWNRAPARLLSLEKSWNASIKWVEDMYSGIHASGGTMFDFTGAVLNSALPVQQWRHLVLSISPAGYRLSVDGKLVATVPAAEFANWNGGGAALEIGNFDGWIDEVVVRSGSGSTPPVTPVNQAPTIQLLTPAPNASFTAPASISVEAAAADADGSVQKVEFYAGIVKIGECTSAPWRIVWTTAEAGPLTLSAVATDNENARSAVTATAVTVLAGRPAAPKNFQAAALSSTQIRLSWADQASNEMGFRIIRSKDGIKWTGVAILPANRVSFTNSMLTPGTVYYYQIKAYNPAGESTALTASARTSDLAPPSAPASITATHSSSAVVISWSETPGAETYSVSRAKSADGPFTVIGSNMTSAVYTDSSVVPGATYWYEVTALNSAGGSPATAPATGRLPAPGANVQFVRADRTSGGNWKGRVGLDGYSIAGDAQKLPVYATLSFAKKSDWTWQQDSTEARVLQRANDNTRIPACWYAADSFDLNVQVTDGDFHKIAFQLLDWDRLGRAEQIDLVDATNGNVLHSATVSNFGDGLWIEYLVQGRVTIRVKNLSGPNAVLNGVFFDPAN